VGVQTGRRYRIKEARDANKPFSQDQIVDWCARNTRVLTTAIRMCASRAADADGANAGLFRFIQIAMGLDYIHSKKVLHRDLKVNVCRASQLNPLPSRRSSTSQHHLWYLRRWPCRSLESDHHS
jgi:serine/threonine protein kinase